MTDTPFVVVVLPVVTLLVVALLGGTCRLGFWLTLALSIAWTPIAGFVAALLSGRRRRPKRRR